VARGDLRWSELFIFTDNTTAEGAYFRGNSDNRLLFSLVLRLRTLEMMGSLCLHVIHVAGTRMIQQGADGLLRGVLTDGVLGGEDMRWHIPLNRSAFDHSPALLTWVQSWCPYPSLCHLTPDEWFLLGHGTVGFECNVDGLHVPSPSAYGGSYGLPLPQPVRWHWRNSPPHATNVPITTTFSSARGCLHPSGGGSYTAWPISSLKCHPVCGRFGPPPCTSLLSLV
jgi:hypothetical protein